MEQPAGCNTQGTCVLLAVPGRWGPSHCWCGILHSNHLNPFKECVEGRFASGMECCKKGAWLLGLASTRAICLWFTLYRGKLGVFLTEGVWQK